MELTSKRIIDVLFIIPILVAIILIAYLSDFFYGGNIGRITFVLTAIISFIFSWRLFKHATWVFKLIGGYIGFTFVLLSLHTVIYDIVFGNLAGVLNTLILIVYSLIWYFLLYRNSKRKSKSVASN
jgi:hypothetical protein